MAPAFTIMPMNAYTTKTTTQRMPEMTLKRPPLLNAIIFVELALALFALLGAALLTAQHSAIGTQIVVSAGVFAGIEILIAYGLWNLNNMIRRIALYVSGFLALTSGLTLFERLQHPNSTAPAILALAILLVAYQAGKFFYLNSGKMRQLFLS